MTDEKPSPEVLRHFSFVVYGTPVPQGSTRAFIPKGWSRPVITAANSKTKPWRQEIAGTALSLMEKRGLSRIGRQIPVKVSAWFQFARPAHLPKRIHHKTTKPDIDKLVRCLLDALTGIVIEDDAQVVELQVSKHFGEPQMRVGVRVLDSSQDADPASVPLFSRPILDSEVPF